MKVVINALAARRGGGQTYLENLLKYIDDFPEIEAILIMSKGVDIPVPDSISRLRAPKMTRNPLLRTTWEKMVLPKKLEELEADILFCPGGLVTTKIPDNCRSVTMFRNMIPFDKKARKKYPLGQQRIRNWILERKLLSSMLHSDLVIFISSYARSVIEERVGKGKINSVTISHGINDEFRVPITNRPPRLSWLPEGEYLLYVSLFEVYKHQLEIVQGYHKLKMRRITREKLILVGKLLPRMAKKVKEEIINLGLQDDVVLTGNIPYHELPAVYANAKINIFASTCENCPNILLEALGAGRPLLVSNCPPMPDFSGKAVVYFDPKSPEDFSEKLESIIDDVQKLKSLAKLSSEQSRLFRWEDTAKNTWTAIMNLCLQFPNECVFNRTIYKG